MDRSAQVIFHSLAISHPAITRAIRAQRKADELKSSLRAYQAADVNELQVVLDSLLAQLPPWAYARAEAEVDAEERAEKWPVGIRLVDTLILAP